MSAAAGPLSRAFFAWHARRVHAPRVDRVARALARRIDSAASLLDVGAGDGSMALAVAKLTGAERVAGVDVLVRPSSAIPVARYDGTTLPFDDGAFEAVVLSDVLHHARDPERVLRESLRVAARVVAVKDHFRFGPLSAAVLYAMDRAGNAAAGVHSPGHYLAPAEWTALVDRVGARIDSIEWPLRIHDLPFRLVTRDEYQFAAGIVRRVQA
jgi:SAM-dependent methyltransferase